MNSSEDVTVYIYIVSKLSNRIVRTKVSNENVKTTRNKENEQINTILVVPYLKAIT